MKRNLNLIITLGAFAILTFTYLALTAQDLVYVVHSQDYFVYDWTHLARISEQPGWVVPYVGSFLTQFAYHPLLGIALLTLLLTLLAWLTVWAMRLPRWMVPLAAVPSVLVVMFILGWDYGLFSTRHYGNLFSPTVGLIFVTLLVGLYERMQKMWMRFAWVTVVVAVLYPLIGMYALLSAVVAVTPGMIHHKDQIKVVSYALLLVVSLPYIEAHTFFLNFNSRFAFIAGLPFMDYYVTQSIWTPLYVALATLLVLRFLPLLLPNAGGRVATIMAAVVALTAVVLVPVHRNNDPNLSTLLAVRHAYDKGHDERVLPLCAAVERPIRSIIMYRNIELWKRGELLDKMFQYTWVSDTIKSRNLRLNTYISGADQYNRLTFWNFSYRWAMERTVMFNPSYSDMKLMANDIVYNRERDLAEKYLAQLENTLYYKDYARGLRALFDPDTYNADSLVQIHRQILLVPKGAIDNTEFCEHMLLKYFTNLYALTEERAELCLAACMIMHKEDEFWKIVLAKEQQTPGIELPRHVQEAALLYALKKNNAALMTQIKLMVGPQGTVCQQFERNQDLLTRLLVQPTMGDINTLATLCRGTYWNYYFNESRQTTIFD